MKKNNAVVFAVILAVLLCAAAALVNAQDSAWKILFDGKELDAKPVLLNDVVYVPAKGTIDAVGLNLKLNEAAKTINIFSKSPDEKKLGVVSGEINLGKTMLDDQQVALCKINEKGDIRDQLRWNIYGGDRSYFAINKPLYSTKVTRSNDFSFKSVAPGTYDLLFFYYEKKTFGTTRIAWKMKVAVASGCETKVWLDEYNTALNDSLFMQ
ncbi:MAG: hypothetical protein V2A78_12625 [bacterium]